MNIVIDKSYFEVGKHTRKGYYIVTDIKDLSVGDRIIITSQPKYWASRHSDRCPLDENIFPYGMEILQMTKVNDEIEATCGTYGWSLDTAVEEGKVLKYSK